MNQTRPTKIVTAVLGAALLLAAAACFLYGRLTTGGSHLTTGGSADQNLLASSLTRLSTAESSRERLQAARWIGEKGETVNSNIIQSLSQSLATDADPSVRAAVAGTFGNLAERGNRGRATPGTQEPMMLEALSAAYDREANPSVRRCIVEAAGQFNHPEAATLLAKALVDADPAVREAAQEARLKRERRLTAAVSG
ncbi:MAG TPA: HEAT repeat domain-containing protein [Candidatus Obscuribacterales bacterium]